MQKITLDHAGVSVANLERSQQFYSDVLGFTHVEHAFELLNDEIRGRVLVNDHGARIELFERQHSLSQPPGHPLESTRQQGWFQLALAMPDVRTEFQRVIAAGAISILEPRIAPDGHTMIAFIGDPDGNLIEFIQRS